MSQNLSDRDRMSRGEGREDEREQQHKEGQPRDTHDWNRQQEQRHRPGDSMAKKQAGQKFVSDEDIVRRRSA